MTFKDLVEKMVAGGGDRPEAEDNVTTDKYLRSLRRQRRIQVEEYEKERLKREIAEHQRNNTRRYVFGTRPHNDLPNQNPSSPPQNTGRPVMIKKNAGWFGKHRL